MSAARAQRKAIADDTMKVLKELGYKTEAGKSVDLKAAINAAVAGAKLYKATENPSQAWADKKVAHNKKTKLEILNATTLGAAKKLVAECKKPGAVVALNFASAKHPGMQRGQWRSGSERRPIHTALTSTSPLPCPLPSPLSCWCLV
jgi:uncharacterized protein (TIGR02452 family)